VLQTYVKAKERCLPEILRERGYRTVWIHGGDADFDGQRDFLRRNGFERVIDRWNFPVGTPTAGWGVTDEALMDTAAETMRSLPRPFFAGILTLTNHHPFETPEGFAAVNVPKQVPGEYGRFLQTMDYTDQALGRLFQRIRNEPYFRNTIFFIYGDHSVPQPPARTIASLRDDLEWRHRIPLLIVAGWLNAPSVVETSGSQVDLPPLAMDLLESGAPPTRQEGLYVPWAGQSPIAGGTHPVLLVRGGSYLGILEDRSAALWTQGTWQQSGPMDAGRLQWALDIAAAERWSLERNRVAPGPSAASVSRSIFAAPRGTTGLP
jgi:arylsulfatase A-like enzyme